MIIEHKVSEVPSM